jgi:hypothetical protein
MEANKSMILTVMTSLAFSLIVFAGIAYSQVIYDSTVVPLPGNLPSVGAEAYAFNELGDNVIFAGTARNPRAVTVTLSSWGCQAGNWYNADCVTTPGATFSLPITFNIYIAGSQFPGSLIATKTQSFAIPYRPSSDSRCTGGRWYDAASGNCFNGLANNITFDLSSLNLVLPNQVVFGLVYNTSHFGPNPIGDTAECYTSSGGCGYDSLNIALSPAVVVGSQQFPGTLYQNSPYGGSYCDGGIGGTGTFRLDSSTSTCNWNGYIPAAKFIAFTIATSKDACKKDGWKELSRADGSSFKNQGDCIQYVNTGR